MKKCASCTKDLPDAALHCVFCGAKQPPAPAVQQQGLAKTAFGYSANDMLDQIRQKGVPQQRGGPQAPPARAAPTPQPLPPQPPPPAYNPPPYNPPRQAPMQPMPPPPPQPIAQQVPPPRFPAPPPPPQGPGPYAGGPVAPNPHGGGPQGGFVPQVPASAPTMFVQSNPQAQQPAMLQSPGPGPGPGPAYGARPVPPAAMQPTLVPPPTQQPTQMAPAPTPAQPPIMRIPVPMPQAYIASDANVSRPLEPWRDSLRLMMFVWGVALLVAFATPLATKPALVFSWNLVIDGAGTARLPPLMIAAVGLLSVIVAAIPMQSAARGLIATVLGLAGIAVPIALVGAPPWQALCSMIGALVLVPALLVREEYRYAALPRLLVTIGAVGILLPFLLPQGGAIPLVAVFKGLFDRPGLEKVQPALALALIVIVVMSLLAWLPAPVSGGAKVWAWLVILWALIVHVTLLVVAGNLGDVVKASPNGALVPWITGGAAFSLGSAYLALVGYGLASVVGKQLE